MNQTSSQLRFASARLTVRLRPLVVGLGLIGLAGSVGACDQGEGDYCQLTSDCSDGLVCVPGLQQCQKPGQTGGTPDAATSTIDAAVPDAASEGPDAALPDAGLDIDAAPGR